MLESKTALALSAALQELSTNAAKYGALSVTSGRVEVQWSNEPAGLIRLRWTEDGGPPVAKPTRRGFGTKMIGGIFASEPGWNVTLDFAPHGLRCIMIFAPAVAENDRDAGAKSA